MAELKEVKAKRFSRPHDVALWYWAQGVREATGNNDGLPAWLFMGGDRLAWCAAFALQCFRESGRWLENSVQDRATLRSSSALWGIDSFAMRHGDLEKCAARIDAGRSLGALVFYGDAAGSDEGVRHVDVVCPTVVHGLVQVVGGNVENQVTLRHVDPQDPSIIGVLEVR